MHLLGWFFCCARFKTGQTFEPTTPNISFVPWSPKRSATMLDSFAELFQHCWGHARALHMVFKVLWVVSFPWCTAGLNIVGSCCNRTHTTGNTNATTPLAYVRSFSLRKQPTFVDATTGFPAKWHLRNERRNSILMTRHYPDLGGATDWSCHVGNLIQPIRSTLPRSG